MVNCGLLKTCRELISNFRIAIPEGGCKRAFCVNFQARNRRAEKYGVAGYFLKRFSNAWRASSGRETRSGEACEPAAGADGAVSFSMVVRNS